MTPGSVRSPGEGKVYSFQYSWASLVAQLVKKPPAMWETWDQCLGWEDPLEKGKATPGLPVYHQLLEFTQTHVHRIGDAIQPSYPLSTPSPPAPNPSQH